MCGRMWTSRASSQVIDENASTFTTTAKLGRESDRLRAREQPEQANERWDPEMRLERAHFRPALL